MRVVSACKKEIAKHQRLISDNQERVASHEMRVQMCNVILGENVETTNDEWIRYHKAHITHSQLMIKVFRSFLKGKCDHLCLAVSCMKENAHNIDESMSALVSKGQYSEKEYMDHMNRMKGEIEAWESRGKLGRGGSQPGRRRFRLD